jgi:uncharacterized protein YutE (UPF0331/DUF86 family)
MTPSRLRAKVIAERVAWIRRMLDGLRALPLTSFETFSSDPRNVAAAESHLRRALEALLDLGRHVLAKGFGQAAVEYKDVARGLADVSVLAERQAALLRGLAGYRIDWCTSTTKSRSESCTRSVPANWAMLRASSRWSWNGFAPTRRRSIARSEGIVIPGCFW